jgi:NitT/TauT family transport system substrate-binding protein
VAKGSLSELKGETVYAFQENGAPGIALKTALTKAEADYEIITSPSSAVSEKVNILFLAAASDVVTEMNKALSQVEYALLPEPNATAVTMNGEKKIAFDLQQELGESYPQACLAVKKSFLENNAEFVEALVQLAEKSAKYCADYPEQTAALAKDALQSAALPSKEAIAAFISGSGQSVLAFERAASAKESILKYLRLLEQYAPASIGGKLPGSGFIE